VKTRGKRPVKDHQELAKLLATLGKSNIASNMSQLAVAASSGSLPVNDDVIKSITEACEAILWIKCALIKALGLQSPDTKSDKVSHDPESK